jgi:hypothetical protein
MRQLFLLPRFRNAYAIRGALVWVAVRLAAGFAQIHDPNVLQEVFILTVVGAAVFVDARRRGEDLFLGNLAVPAGAIFGWALPLAILLEAVVP